MTAQFPVGLMRGLSSLTWMVVLAIGLAFAVRAGIGGSTTAATGVLSLPSAASPESAQGSEARAIRAATGAYVSPWLLELLKLSRAGIEQQVIEAFIQSAGTFNLTPRLIIYLREAGVSPSLVASIIQHDSDLENGLLPIPPAPPNKVPLLLTELPVKGVSGLDRPEPSDSAKPLVEPAFEKGGSAEPGSEILDSELPPALEDLSYLVPIVKASAYPVREPYPVRLTDPILVYRGTWRTPNVQIIRLFPNR